MTLYDVAVSVMVAVTSQDQRSYIKIECQCNKTAKEIFSALQEACGIYALSYYQVTRWVNSSRIAGNAFKMPTEQVELTATDSYNTEQLKRFTC